MYRLVRGFIAAQVFYTIAASSGAPSVQLGAGTVYGATCDTNPVAVFYKSIPFAQPPTGALRFAPPKPYAQHYPNGSLNATVPPPACVQFGKAFAEPGPSSEDCLYLNVWAPANLTKKSSLPVRVWIYGGDNSAGGISDPMYDGCHVPSTEALMVSINYRVGPLGFMALESAGIGGNQGIQDILLGLEWVQQNIASFGGDPNKVLLHGQSAGAFNTFAIATLPQAPTLFKAAILQSGGGRDSVLNNTAQATGASYATSLKCKVTDLSCLQSKSSVDLIATYANLPIYNTKKYQGLALGDINTPDFQPYVDGNIISNQPSQQGVRVPSVFGSTTMEGTLFALGEFKSSGGPGNVSESDFKIFLNENFGPAAASIQEAYPISAFNSTPFPAFYAISKVLGDSAFFCPSYRGLNTAAAKHVPVWTYLFAHDSHCGWIPQESQGTVELLGATHTAEIPFMLGMESDLPTPNGSCQMTPIEKDISGFMNHAWTAMAAHQSPTNDNDSWPAYQSSESSLGINILNATAPGYVNYTVCKLWDAIDASAIALANQTLANSTSNATGATTSNITNASSTPKSSSANVNAVVEFKKARFIGFITLFIIFGFP